MGLEHLGQTFDLPMATWPDTSPDVRYLGVTNYVLLPSCCLADQARHDCTGNYLKARTVEDIFICSTYSGVVDTERLYSNCCFHALRVGWRPPLLDSENRGLATAYWFTYYHAFLLSSSLYCFPRVHPTFVLPRLGRKKQKL